MRISGSGGYLFTPPGGYDESSRTFEALFDGEAAGVVECYANTCQGEVTVPDTAEPGRHEVTVEGGSRIFIKVIEEALEWTWPVVTYEIQVEPDGPVGRRTEVTIPRQPFPAKADCPSTACDRRAGPGPRLEFGPLP